MPSDPAGMQPPGVLIRPAPDFFDDSMCYGGAARHDLGPGDSYFSISLFNDGAAQGRLLKVYGLTTGNDLAGSQLVYPIQGTPLGTLVGACQPNRVDAATIAGQIWVKQDHGVAPFPNPNPLPAVPMVIGNFGFGGGTIFSTFPMFILPVGWSLVTVNTQDTSVVFAGFWFQVANE